MRLEYPSTRLGWKFDPPNVPWKVGSLQEKIDSEMRAMMSGQIRTDATTRLFANNNRSTTSPDAAYSADLWCAGKIDLSPISVINAGQPTTDRFPVILVHERFVYAAAHVRGNGPYVFKRPDGGYEIRTVLGWFAFPTLTYDGGIFGPGSLGRDASIGLLSEPITTIEPAKLLPADWPNYFPPITKPLGITSWSEVPLHYLPALCRRARKNSGEDFARIAVCAIQASSEYERDYRTFPSVDPVTSYFYGAESSTVASHGNYQAEWDTPIGGDSGSPFFYPFDGKMLLVGALYTAGGGPNVWQSYEGLEQGMNALATTHGVPGAGSLSLSKLNLSQFSTYP